MKRRWRKAAFTVIEVLVAVSLMAIVAGAVALGVQRSVRAAHLKTSKERIERLMLQAFRFSAVSGHVGDVVIFRAKDGTYQGHVNFWEADTGQVSLLTRSCESIGSLSGISSLSLNGCTVHKAVFRFFGGHGLSTVYAYDQYDRALAPSDFGFSSEETTHRKRELEMILFPTKNPTSGEKISLDPYLLSLPHSLPFPNEYLASGL